MFINERFVYVETIYAQKGAVIFIYFIAIIVQKTKNISYNGINHRSKKFLQKWVCKPYNGI